MMFRFRTLEDYSINEPARLVIYDNRASAFVLKEELRAGEEFCLSSERLEEHLDYKFKIQTKSGGRWVDRVNYARLLPESETKDGIKYLFYPCKGSDKLVVVFQAINRKPGYNYIKTLSGVHANRLYIKDEYGEDEETHSSYYLGKGRSFDIADKVQGLISEVVSSLKIERSDCVFAGSSKGGFAALYHGYRFGAGHILPGGPQVLLGDFLNSPSEESVLPPILEHIAGGLDDVSVAWANRIMQEAILSATAPYPDTEIHVGSREPHYRKHVLPFLELVEKAKIPNVTVDLGDYSTHDELATHYPKFLRDRVETIIGSRANSSADAFQQTNLYLTVCPMCGDALNEVEAGQNCRKCGSRARVRSMKPLVQEVLVPLMGNNSVLTKPLLAFAMTAMESSLLLPLFQEIKSVSLFGTYAKNHESGVDIRDLSRYAADSFSGVFGCLLFDYFKEHEAALRECYRVLAPGGTFITHIAPSRLMDGRQPPAPEGEITSRAGYFEYLPQGVELPSVKVGRSYFLSAMRFVGLETSTVRVEDAVKGIYSEWFIGRKPVTGNSSEAVLSVKSCPICGDSLLVVDSGQNCRACGSRARTRSIFPLVSQVLKPLIGDNDVVKKPLLAFSITPAESDLLAPLFPLLKSVSLFGNYSKDHESGVDIRDLSRYESESFSGVFACGVFDYFEEHEEALAECFRVITLGGVVCIHIMPYRVVNNDEPPRKKRMYTPAAKPYLPEGHQLIDVRVGRSWFLATMRRVGFDSRIIRIDEAVTGVNSDWFIGIKRSSLRLSSESLLSDLQFNRAACNDATAQDQNRDIEQGSIVNVGNVCNPSSIDRHWSIPSLSYKHFKAVLTPFPQLKKFDHLRKLVRSMLAFGTRVSHQVKSDNRVTYEGVSREIHRATVRASDNPLLFNLIFDEIKAKEGPPLYFLEDHFVPMTGSGGSTREVVVTDRKHNVIYTSNDAGATWRPRYPNVTFEGSIHQSFTLSNGHRIIRTHKQALMYHFDEHDQLFEVHQTGAWPWHGSQGIGESASGTVMYAEYVPLTAEDGVVPLSIWRYTPLTRRWEKTLTLEAGVQPPKGEIRHFHICRPNPRNPVQWILASGDIQTHNRLWLSEDDGQKWHELDVKSSIAPGIPFEYRHRILRFTQFSATQDGDLIWGTDDTLGIGKSALIKMSIRSMTPNFELLGWLSTNCIRNIISLGNDAFLLLSESKIDVTAADCIIFNAHSGEKFRLSLPNLLGTKSPVTASLGSSALVDGIGFLPSIGCILTTSRNGILRIRLEEENTKTVPYEDLSNVDRTKAVISATEIIEKGWARRKYPVISLNDPIPWALRTQQERSWNYHLHCWDMLDSLLKAYSETQEKHFLRPAIRVAGEWADKHSNFSQPDLSPFAWYDMAVGLRAYRLAYIIDAGVAAGLLDQHLRTKLWALLEQHQAYLADDKNILFHNNHGYYQVAGQLAMGRRFAGESPLMAQALEQGKERLKVMLAQQFGKDGIHKEHSPDYHRMVYDTLKAMIDAGLVEAADTIVFAETIERALSWFVLPSQHIVNFGDSDYRLMRRKPDEAERKWRTAEMRYVVSGGKVGQLPAEHLAVFPEGGYVAVRAPAGDAPQEFWKSSYLAQVAAFHSRTHKHADDLSFIWSDRGSDLLVDAGRYGYIGKAEEGSDLWLDGHWYSDPNRVYCESTRAHNTLEFDGKNYPRKGVKPYGSALRRWVQDASGIVAVETECRHFESLRRARVLVFLPGKWLVALDWFHDNTEQPHDVKQWFHLAPHLQLLLQVGGYLVSVPGSIEPLRAISLLQGPFASHPYLSEKEPVMQGWWSAKEHDIVPNFAFCYELSRVSTGVFATLFSFSNSLATDMTWNNVNVSGRKAQFRWKDETGAHELRLERPESGDLSVAYSMQ